MLLAGNQKGHRPEMSVELLDRSQIISSMESAVEPLVGQLLLFDELPSTNSYLMNGDAAMPTGSICLAERQTAGRGRMGRSWVSPFGCNLYLSVLWHFNAGPAVVAGLSLAVGVAVMRVLTEAGVPEVGLKWPNDIVWKQRKLGGILVELASDGGGPCRVVIGIGLNLRMPADSAAAIDQPWVDLAAIQPTVKWSRNRLAAMILNQLLPLLADYQKSGLTPSLTEWRQWDSLRGQRARLHLGSSVICGVVQGIEDDGRLIIETEAGEMKRFASGEVTFHSSD